MTNIDRVKFQTFANLYPCIFLFLHSLAPFCCFPLSIPRFMLKKLHLFMLYTSHCILFLITYFFLPKHLPQTINLLKMFLCQNKCIISNRNNLLAILLKDCYLTSTLRVQSNCSPAMYSINSSQVNCIFVLTSRHLLPYIFNLTH